MSDGEDDDDNDDDDEHCCQVGNAMLTERDLCCKFE